MTDVTDVIVCENLVKIYSLSGVEVMALQGLELTVQAGEMLGIVGASGSGKTTLMNVLGGLDRPTAGKVSAFGQDLLKLSAAELDVYRRTKVGFVWQQAGRNLVPYLTALENVELPLRLAHAPASERLARPLELLEVLGMSHRLHHRPDQLSGGEQQRAAIGVAMANHPSLLLADEPTGELDTATSVEVFNALRQVNARYGASLIIVSHDARIGQFVDRVVMIRDGRTSSETRESRVESRESVFGIGDSGLGIRPEVDDTRSLSSDSRTPTLDSPLIPDSRLSNSDSRFSPDSLISPLDSRPPNSESLITNTQSLIPPPDELVILDHAGRMQIPREFLERLNIGDRVRLELENGHISIQPVEGHGRKPEEKAADLPGPEDLYVEAEDPAPVAAKASLFGKIKNFPQQIRRKKPQINGMDIDPKEKKP